MIVPAVMPQPLWMHRPMATSGPATDVIGVTKCNRL